MDAQEYSTTRSFSASGTVRLLSYVNACEVEYIGLANFNAPEDGEFWYITKFTYDVVETRRVVVSIQDSATRHKWTDRANSSIMGWR